MDASSSTGTQLPPHNLTVPRRFPKSARLLYGTAWKDAAAAEELTYAAIKAGWPAIDTGSVEDHYKEQAVGNGMRRAIAEGVVTRKNLFIQTKFTFFDATRPGGPDIWPYHPLAPLELQIRETILSSIRRLDPHHAILPIPEDPNRPNPGYIDCIILHAPSHDGNFVKTHRALEILQSYLSPSVRRVGIGNVTYDDLRALWPRPRNQEDRELQVHRGLWELKPITLPAAVQNRFQDRPRAVGQFRFDAGVRRFCRERKIEYQGFHVLSANPYLWDGTFPAVAMLSSRAGVPLADALFSLCVANEISCLSGTTRVAVRKTREFRLNLSRYRDKEWVSYRVFVKAFRVWIDEEVWMTSKDILDAIEQEKQKEQAEVDAARVVIQQEQAEVEVPRVVIEQPGEQAEAEAPRVVIKQEQAEAEAPRVVITGCD